MEWIVDGNVAQEYGASLEDLSLWWYDSDVGFKGENMAFKTGGGYSGLVENYASSVLDRTKLRTKVLSIDWSSSPCRVRFVSTQHQQAVVEEIYASHVVLTVPLGVLRAETIDFVPRLPKSKRRAIHRIGLGLLNKVVLIWDEQQKESLPWFLKDNVGWVERIVASPNRQGLWTEFYSTQTGTGCPMVYSFLAGRMAESVERFSDEEIETQCLAALRSLCCPQQEESIPDPASVVISRWGQDEFAMGAYSFNQLGGEPRDRRNLGASLENRLHFAGEATSNKYFATTHGAFLSGIEASTKVLKQLVKENRI